MIEPDYTQTTQFLQVFSPQGPYLLAAIPVEGGSLKSEYFETLDGVEDWCRATNPGHGLYYHVGTPRMGVKYRMVKGDVGRLDWLWADVDPAKGKDLVKERERIEALLTGKPPKGVPSKPSLIVDSGGGYQALWRLKTPIILNTEEDVAESERLTRFFVGAYGADAQAFEVARILRLPGTINWPGKKKKAELGRKPALSQAYMLHKESTEFSFFSLAPRMKKEKKVSVSDVNCEIRKKTYTKDTLPRGINTKWESLIVECDESFYFEDSSYPSKSEVVIGFVRYMLENDYAHQVVYDILLSPDLRISKHVYEQHNVDRYAKRQISRAMEFMSKEPKGTDETFIMTSEKKHGDGRITPPQIIKTNIHNVRLAILKAGIPCEYNALADEYKVNEETLQKYSVTQVAFELETKNATTFPMMLVGDVLQMVCRENTYNPVVQYLKALPKWDKKVRLDTWLMDYCGADDNALNRAYGRLTLLAAAKRALEPGCKYDEMLILEGFTGDGKSDLLQRGLCPNPHWFSDSVTMHRSRKEFMEDVAGHWIVEWGELADLKKADTDKLKALLSCSVDKARMAYDRSRTDKPRSFILIATTNRKDYLQDETGNRRFWCVACEGNLLHNIPALAAARDQIWAEAKESVENGESIRLDPALYHQSGLRAEERLEESPVEDVLVEAIGNREGLIKVTTIIKFLGSKASDWQIGRVVTKALRRMNFKNKVIAKDGVSQRVWRRGASTEWIELQFDDEKSII